MREGKKQYQGQTKITAPHPCDFFQPWLLVLGIARTTQIESRWQCDFFNHLLLFMSITRTTQIE
jgi:hypothetical protein